MSRSVEVILVDSCLRDGAGGSPTAVVIADGRRFADAELTRIPRLAGTSHLAVIGPQDATGNRCTVRFFTPEGELPGCGHGTVAVVAVVSSTPRRVAWRGLLRAGGRDIAASAVWDSRSDTVEAWFDQGRVTSHAAGLPLVQRFLAALGLKDTDLSPADSPTVASPGIPRLLIPVTSRRMLAELQPDHERLAAESRRHGLLGCFVYTPPSPGQRATARMFAPAIGVAEDVANANSTGCLAAHMLALGNSSRLLVDQGDALVRPSTVYATAVRTPQGVTARVGATARVVDTFAVALG